jgi:hypothetical protein
MDFKIKQLDNIKFSHAELVEYYEKIKNEYQNLRWDASMLSDHKDHKVSKLYSWAIQSNLKDPSKPCAPYHIDTSDAVDPKDSFSVPTDLIFGFAQRVIEAFPNVRQTVIAAHPPGTKINFHIDNDEFVKIHIPIYANNQSYFEFEDEKFLLKEGNAYLVNTALMHATDNLGDTDRVHFIFKIKKSDVDVILNNEWILDPQYLDFDILELPNVKFNFNEVTNYWNAVKTDYDYLKWTITDKDVPLDPLAATTIGIYGYGILSNLDNVDLPCNPPGNSNKDIKHKRFLNPTKLMFGIAEKIIKQFPKCEELGITAHPPNTSIPSHIDKDSHVRIHIPIVTNEHAWFQHGATKMNLEVGKAYIVNTKRMHSTINAGNSDRIHILFKVPYALATQILNTEINL